jgi:GT2 family glycosyltransferase
MTPRITVVLLTHNRIREAVETVGTLLALPERPRVIVVDNASTDGTTALLAERFPELDVVRAESNLGAAGRNLGAARVTTEFMAFCDDDSHWLPGSLARAVELLDCFPRVGLLSARMLVGDSRELDDTCHAMSMSPLPRIGLPGPALVGYMAGACVFRTALFLALGGYEPRLFIGCEEELVALDVLSSGHAIVYADELIVHHRPSALRDAPLRRRMLARNAAWIAWLRLPLAEALCATWHAVAALRHEGHPWADAAGLMRGIPWALAHRRVVASNVCAMRQCVRLDERQKRVAASGAVGKK